LRQHQSLDDLHRHFYFRLVARGFLGRVGGTVVS
jgi:hypothetical protein